MTPLTAGELRNRVIADLLFNIRYIEGWNTGIRRMRDEMRRHGLPEPAFAEVGETFKVTFQGPGEHILDLIPEAGVTDLRALGLNERQVEALRLMVNEGVELNNRRYREIFDITDRSALRDLNRLLDLGLIRRLREGRSAGYVATRTQIT